jgi:hypothetical protein
MNSTGLTIASGGTATAMLGEFLMWITKWPLQPLDQNQALAAAGLLIGAGGLVAHYLQSKKAATPQNPTQEGN